MKKIFGIIILTFLCVQSMDARSMDVIGDGEHPVVENYLGQEQGNIREVYKKIDSLEREVKDLEDKVDHLERDFETLQVTRQSE